MIEPPTSSNANAVLASVKTPLVVGILILVTLLAMDGPSCCPMDVVGNSWKDAGNTLQEIWTYFLDKVHN